MHGEGGEEEGEGRSRVGMERRKKGKEHWKEEWKKDDTGGEVTTLKRKRENICTTSGK